MLVAIHGFVIPWCRLLGYWRSARSVLWQISLGNVSGCDLGSSTFSRYLYLWSFRSTWTLATRFLFSRTIYLHNYSSDFSGFSACCIPSVFEISWIRASVTKADYLFFSLFPVFPIMALSISKDVTDVVCLLLWFLPFLKMVDSQLRLLKKSSVLKVGSSSHP